jgi:DNA-binding PadR family transcriptional regulator
MRHILPDSSAVHVVRAFLDGEHHNAPELIGLTGLARTTVYGALRRMRIDGWVKQSAVPGTARRDYQASELGLRAMRYVVDLSDRLTEVRVGAEER